MSGHEKQLSVSLAACVLGLSTALTAPAQTIAINNAGFESDVVADDGAFVVLQPQGWSLYDPGSIVSGGNNAVGVIRPNLGGEYFPGGAPQGLNAALVYLAGPQNAEAGLQQTLSATLQLNTRYSLIVDVGNIASGTSLPGSSGGSGVFYNLDGFPGYRLDLLAGSTVIGSDNNTIGNSIAEGQFGTATLTVVILGSHPQFGQSLGIRLVNLKAPGTVSIPNIEADFDNVRLTATPVPEPAGTAAALGLAAWVLVRWHRRKRDYR